MQLLSFLTYSHEDTSQFIKVIPDGLGSSQGISGPLKTFGDSRGH